MRLEVLISFHLKSAANLREHWAVRSKRVRAEREAAHVVVRAAGGRGIKLPAKVTITRIAPRELDDDNLQAAAKGIRDGVADGLGLAGDRHPGLTWIYKQEKGKPSAVRIEVEEE